MKKTLIILFFFIVGLVAMSQQKEPSKPAAKAKPTTAKPQPKPATNTLAEAKQRGKIAYETYCLACHQADGAGVPRMNPPLIKTPYVLGDKKKLVNIVLKGLNAGVEIDGETYSNPMPQQDFLKDQEIADILTYVRNSFGNKASIVTVTDVKGVRAANK